MIKDYANITWKNIRNRKVRSWLTVLGIVIGVATIIALISIGQGLQNAIGEQFEKLGVKNLRIIPGGLNGPPNEEYSLDKSVKDIIEDVKGVDYVNSVLIRSASATYSREEQFVGIFAEDTEVSGKGFADLDIKTIEGRMLQEGDQNSALLGYDVAYDTFKEDVSTRTTIYIKDQPFKVVGILEETGGDADGRIFIPLSKARELFNAPHQVSVFVVTLEDGLNIYEMQNSIDKKLERELGEDTYQIFTPDQILKEINQVLGAVQGVLVAIAAISILVGAVGIMNSMYTSVLERTKEIGIMKSIGAGNGQILSLFLIESALVGLTGGIIGIIIGSILAKLTEIGAKLAGFSLLKVSIDPMTVILTLCLAMLIGIISGFFPALRAARLKPVDALRYE